LRRAERASAVTEPPTIAALPEPATLR
jgi:hypothetical protein